MSFFSLNQVLRLLPIVPMDAAIFFQFKLLLPLTKYLGILLIFRHSISVLHSALHNAVRLVFQAPVLSPAMHNHSVIAQGP